MTEPGAVAPTCPTETAVQLTGRDVRLRPARPVLRGIDMTIPRGKVVAIMGGSGCGKTTILRLIGGQLRPQRGHVPSPARIVPALDRDALFALRRKIGMLFQFGALFTDMSVFENIAFPLREHTELPEELIRDLVLMKLQRGRPARRRAAACPPSCPAAWRGAWRSRAPSRSTRCSSCTTSRSPASTRSRSASSAS